MNMFIWAGIFLILAILSAIFGFKKTKHKGSQVTKILFFIFCALFIVTLVFGLLQQYANPEIDDEETTPVAVLCLSGK